MGKILAQEVYNTIFFTKQQSKKMAGKFCRWALEKWEKYWPRKCSTIFLLNGSQKKKMAGKFCRASAAKRFNNVEINNNNNNTNSNST